MAKAKARVRRTPYFGFTSPTTIARTCVLAAALCIFFFGCGGCVKVAHVLKQGAEAVINAPNQQSVANGAAPQKPAFTPLIPGKKGVDQILLPKLPEEKKPPKPAEPTQEEKDEKKRKLEEEARGKAISEAKEKALRVAEAKRHERLEKSKLNVELAGMEFKIREAMGGLDTIQRYYILFRRNWRTWNASREKEYVDSMVKMTQIIEEQKAQYDFRREEGLIKIREEVEKIKAGL